MSRLVNYFKPLRVLNYDPIAHSIVLLGSTTEHTQAILILKKTPFSETSSLEILWDRLEGLESNDIYHILLGWLHPNRVDPDVKIDLICPATEVHVRKYTKQNLKLVQETPEAYQTIVKPYIDSFPPERTSWVKNILSFKSESEKLLYIDDDFVILPDFKWDLKDISTLYLQAIVRDDTIKCLRDLRYDHLEMLRRIRREAHRVVGKWGVENGGLRLYVHYQPSYYHFHVHIVQVNYSGFPGISVGQAHLLDDIISLLELHGNQTPGIFEKLTLSYTLGEFHGLYDRMVEATKY